MKPEVRIETDSEAEESPEIVIRCREITPEIHRLAQRLQAECDGIGQEILLTLCGRDYIVALDHILFFETSGEHTVAHTDAVQARDTARPSRGQSRFSPRLYGQTP